MVMETFWIWILLMIVFSPLILGIMLFGMQKKVRIIHSVSGIAKSGYVGFSWTYLLFGWFVPVIRGELGVGVLRLVVTFVSFGLSQLVFPFLYNRQYMNRMLTSGWALDPNDPHYDIARQKLDIVS
jgi:CHASE2 domain-containing sensor protein